MGIHSGDNIPGAMEGPNIRFLGRAKKPLMYIAASTLIFLAGTQYQKIVSNRNVTEGIVASLIEDRQLMMIREQHGNLPFSERELLSRYQESITDVLELWERDGLFQRLPGYLLRTAFPDGLGAENER